MHVFMAMYAWLCIYGYVWLCMYNYVCMAMYGYACMASMAMYDHVCMAISVFRYVCMYLAVSFENSIIEAHSTPVSCKMCHLVLSCNL